MGDSEQEEELEVLRSIYEGDPHFKEISPTVFQYKYGEDGDPHSFLLEIQWPAEYPSTAPTINLDAFYNKHILPDVKTAIAAKVDEEATQWLGSAVTYTLFEWVREHLEELIAEQPDSSPSEEASSAIDQLVISEEPKLTESSKKPKKEQMTKAQKRKMWDRQEGKGGERPRGWDWIDVIKHLSQTGTQQPSKSSLASDSFYPD